MKILDVKQGSGEWLAARAGVFTASEFDNLMTPLWKKRTGATPETYILRKLAEKIMGFPLESPNAWVLEQGAILESEALPWLQLSQDLNVQRVGFVTSDCGRMGCSPDGLIGDDGGVEIKCPQPVNHLRYLLAGTVPDDYLAQVHGSLYVTGRKWWKFVSYSRQFPPVILHVERDENIIAKIDEVLTATLDDFAVKLEKVKALKAEYDAPITAAGLKRMAEEEKKERAKYPDRILPGERFLIQQGKLTEAEARARAAQS